MCRLNGAASAAVGGGRRGRVSGYSRASRRRCLRLFASLNRHEVELPLFVTLTYPAAFPADPRRWKRDLDVMLKRVLRRWPAAAIVWKLEPQKRGAPHFHLAVFGVGFIERGWLSAAWYEVVGSGDPKHLQAGTQVERVKNWRGVMAYAAKYIGKEVAAVDWPEYVGRWWGVAGRANLPELWYHQRLGRGPWFAFRRVLYRYLKQKGVIMRHSMRRGVTVFLDSEVGFRLVSYYGSSSLGG